MQASRSFLFLALGVLLTGCDAVSDYMPSGGAKEKLVERERLAQQREETAAREKEAGERAALRRHIEASCKALEAALSDSKRKSAAAAADREALSARIRELASAPDENGRTRERHVVLADMLADDGVNAIAKKYMDRDFRMIRLEFIDAMRDANGAIRRRDAALNRNQQDYDKAVSGGGDGASQSKQALKKSVTDLRNSIAALERKEKELQRTLSMSSGARTVRDRKERELREVSDRLKELHVRYDEFRTAQEAESLSSRAVLQANQDAERASRLKQQADLHVVRLFADLKNPAEITSECERRTIGELERRVIAAGEEHGDALRKTSDGLIYLKSVAGGLDGLNMSALRSMRETVDARLAGLSVGN